MTANMIQHLNLNMDANYYFFKDFQWIIDYISLNYLKVTLNNVWIYLF